MNVNSIRITFGHRFQPNIKEAVPEHIPSKTKVPFIIHQHAAAITPLCYNDSIGGTIVHHILRGTDLDIVCGAVSISPLHIDEEAI
jgi:hypothetical protein